jgi:hypothetical protein
MKRHYQPSAQGGVYYAFFGGVKRLEIERCCFFSPFVLPWVLANSNVS